MAITTALCSSFKKELFEALHNFKLSGGNTFKIALFTSLASLDADTTVYSSSQEVSSVNYTAGGQDLTRIDPALDGAVAMVDFDDIVWNSVTLTARGALIYNSTNGNRAVSVHNFGSDKVATAGDFSILFPAAAAATAIIRIA